MKKRLAVLFAILMVAGVVFSGCTSTPAASTAPAASASAGTSAAASAEATATTAANNGAILRFGTSSLDGKFNPVLCSGVYDQYVATMLFDGLVGQNPDGSVNKDGLASDWTISDDKKTYTFKMKDAKFSNGDPVTADDVIFTYETIANKKYDGPLGNVLIGIVGVKDFTDGKATSIAGIKKIDDKTVSFTIEEPNVVKIYDLGVGILDKKYYQFTNYDDFKAKNATPVGCGRFNFSKYTPGQSLEVVTNPDYYGTKAKIGGVTILMIPDDTQIAALKSGQVDLINPTANKDNVDAMNDPSVTVKEFPSNGYNVIGMNLKNPIFADKRVRQALEYGLNLKQFIDTEWQGLAQQCLTPIATVSWAYPDVSDLNTYAYDPEKAKQLLEEAGWKDTDGDGIREKDGKKLTWTWLAYNDVAWPQHLVALATEEWKAIGVDLKSELVDFNTVSDRVFTKQQYDMFNIGWSLSVDPDPVGLYDKASDVPGGNNATHYYNERAEEIFKQGRLEFDQTKRTALYKEWAKIANDDLPYLFVAVRDEIWGVSNKFQGFDKMGPYYNWVYCLGDVTAK